jgi:hypothetical protein
MNAVRGLHLGDRKANSEKGVGKIKVLIFHYVPPIHVSRARQKNNILILFFSLLSVRRGLIE